MTNKGQTKSKQRTKILVSNIGFTLFLLFQLTDKWDKTLGNFQNYILSLSELVQAKKNGLVLLFQLTDKWDKTLGNFQNYILSLSELVQANKRQFVLSIYFSNLVYSNQG